MSLPKVILCAISMLFLTYGQNNLFQDGTFEQGAGSFQLELQPNTAATMEISTDAAHSGSMGAKVTVTTVTDQNWHIQVKTPTNWTAAPNQKYRLSFYAKSSGSLPIHVAFQDVLNNWDYMGGADISLTDSWRKCEITHLSSVSGQGALQFSVFIGAHTGIYYFDDFTLEAVVEANPGTITLPEQGAFQTGVYRNLFKEFGKSDEAINEKVEAAFQSLFHGDQQNERIYFESGTDMAYIKAIDSDDIRSEGLSYGMMIAVQLDKKEEFDKIWKFAHTRVQYQSGERKGYFPWNVNPNGFSVKDSNSAPDGEEYFAMALFFASHRWGDGEGVYAYSTHAKQLLHDMLHLEERNGGVVNGLTNMFNKDEKKVVFVPKGNDATYTDPSYHLPAFYKLWAEWADEDQDFWRAAADTSKAFLQRAMHPQTGLTTDYASFSGQPQQTSFNELSHRFAYDSWRVGMNIGMDCHWFGNDQWHPQHVDKLLRFFKSQGSAYKSIYEQAGTPLPDNNHHSTGLIAGNGASALAATDSIAWDFVAELWETPVPSGQYRYYDGMLYMLSILHGSGKFRIWHSDQSSIRKPTNTSMHNRPHLKIAQHKNSLLVSFPGTGAPATVRLHTPLGQTLYTQKVGANVPGISFDCSTFARGLYYVSLKTAHGAMVEKLVLR